MNFTKYGLIPKELNGSSTTHYPDGITYDSSIISYIATGGHGANADKSTGIFWQMANRDVSYSAYVLNTSLSCKPLAPIEEVE